MNTKAIPSPTLAERLLITLSLPTQNVPQNTLGSKKDPTDKIPLLLLRSEYENFDNLVRGKKVLDFGCGEGAQSVELADQLECEVTGVDNDNSRLAKANTLKQSRGLNSDQLEFISGTDNSHQNQYDVVISHNSMEHFSDPSFIIKLMRSLLKKDGRLLITFGPPWFAPYGSHMKYFCKVPWINLLFSEQTIMKVRHQYRCDGAQYYKDVDAGLNMMTLKRFESLMKENNLSIEHFNYKGVKNLNFLTKIPMIREMFTNQVSVVIKKS